MRHWHKVVIALAALAACVLVGGVALAASSGVTRSKAPTVRKATNSKAKSSRSQLASQARQGRENTPGDRDKIQQGDQSSSDSGQGESESQSESESGADHEQGRPGEPAQGHEDPPGDVNHECSGDCRE
jgi:hypothetical protein